LNYIQKKFLVIFKCGLRNYISENTENIENIC
jgi:hypothetical protein